MRHISAHFTHALLLAGLVIGCGGDSSKDDGSSGTTSDGGTAAASSGGSIGSSSNGGDDGSGTGDTGASADSSDTSNSGDTADSADTGDTDDNGGSTTYDATHFVASYAESRYIQRNAASDHDPMDDGGDRGAAAYAACRDDSTPCTLRVAVENCSAGDRIQMAPGRYVATQTVEAELEGNHHAWYHVQCTGTPDDPVVFFAEHPAAYNRDDPSLWTEFYREFGGPLPDANPEPFFGITTDYITLDGIYANADDTTPAEEEGIVLVGGAATGGEVRRVYVVMDDVDFDTGENKSAIFLNNHYGARVTDSYFDGNASNDQHNSAAIQTRWCDSCVIENNFFDGVTALWMKGQNWGPFVDEGGPYQRARDSIIRYNFVQNAVVYAFRVLDNHSIRIYQNFFHSDHDSVVIFLPDNGDPVNAGVPVEYDVHNNTIITSGNVQTNTSGFFWRGGGNTDIGTQSQLHSNIVVDDGSPYVYRWDDAQDSGNEMGNWNIYDRNVYFSRSGSVSLSLLSGSPEDKSFAQWQAYAAGLGQQPGQPGQDYEANSSESDPGFVDPDYINPINGDWTLRPNDQDAVTIGLDSANGGVTGAWITGREDIGLRETPTY